MQENFLHHIWALQYFEKQDLRTTEGDPVDIFSPGNLNTDAGPDFSQARLRIGDIHWVGNVEIHVRSSAWAEHHHGEDPAYESVILHVVWQDDVPVRRKDTSRLATVELRGRVNEVLIRNYRQLITSSFSIPCRKHLPSVRSVVKTSMVSRALAHRLEHKAEEVIATGKSCGMDWEDTTYQWLAGAFGFKINKEPFFQLARAMPLRILQKHSDLTQIEALLFGQAGFLEGNRGDEYYLHLRKEYRLLAHKYGICEQRMQKSQWLFLRLRPSNFPTLRIGQFASLIHHRRALFSTLLHTTSAEELIRFFSVDVSPYWSTRFRFNSTASLRVHALGRSSVDVILVNAVVPLLSAYARYADLPELMDRGLHILEHLPPEANGITRRWSDLGMPPQNAMESQGQIELFNTFCREKRCLQCAIGAAIVRPTEDEPGTAAP